MTSGRREVGKEGVALRRFACLVAGCFGGSDQGESIDHARRSAAPQSQGVSAGQSPAASRMIDFAMKLYHSMIRVRDLAKSLEFYCGFLGLQEVRRNELGDEATLVFLSDEDRHYFIELTFNKDGRDYEVGTQFGHLAFLTLDLDSVIEDVKAKGWWYRESKPGNASRYIFVKDPDGYDIEILQAR